MALAFEQFGLLFRTDADPSIGDRYLYRTCCVFFTQKIGSDTNRTLFGRKLHRVSYKVRNDLGKPLVISYQIFWDRSVDVNRKFYLFFLFSTIIFNVYFTIFNILII